ncbi:type I restriction enzyme [Streptococcus pneumoniae]|nr:type I restriction enzyme [Streptococcus pneumoniae]
MNWVVIKIKDIFSMNTGLSYKKGDLSINNKGVRIIRGGNIKPLEFSLLDNDYYIDTQFISSEQVYLKHNQLITPVSTSLEHIGKFARIDKDYDGVVAGGFIFQLTPFESSEIISKFLLTTTLKNAWTTSRQVNFFWVANFNLKFGKLH